MKRPNGRAVLVSSLTGRILAAGKGLNKAKKNITAGYAGGDITVDMVEIEEARWYTAENLPALPAPFSIARRLVNWFVENSAK